MRRLITILFVLLFTFLAGISHAQNFPVRVTPILTPPYTPFLTDYTDAGSEKLTVQILLNDVTVPEYRCKLRLTIEGVNISITTNPSYVPLPIVLSGGVPQIVYGSDLTEYFKPSNLVFQGINQNDFERKGNQLPEGIYRISIEVLDYNRGTVVSNKGSATAWMILNDPPFINMPVNNSKLRPLNPQNIVFQWTPRHRGSPNAAFTTEYEVKLVEIWPQGRNPYDAINTSRPIFETTVDNTLVVYGPAETPLVLGREYALQIKARDTGGKDLFKNNGYSEVIRFVYGNECPVPTSLFTDDIGTVKARIRWQGNGQNTNYIVRYRQKAEGAYWFEDHTDQTLVNLTQLKAGTTYEYQVNGECEGFRSEWSTVQAFTTLAVNPDAFVCGDPSAVPPPDGSPPLPALFINDFINAGGFDVVVTKATGSNGRFTGEGLAVIPWFNSAKVRMTFNNISVNKSYQVTAGDMVSVWNPNSKMLIKNEKTLAEGGGKGLDGLATMEADTLIQLTGSIITVFINSDSNIVVQTNQGDVVIPTEKGKSYAIADQLGNGYLIDKDGKITKTTATDVANAAARGQREYSKDPNLSVLFAKSEGTGNGTKYGFDDQREGTLQENYQQTDNGKWIAWKAMPSGSTDVVAVTAEGTTDLSKVKFKVEGPNPQSLPIAIGTQVLTLTGSTHGTTEELLAYYPQQDTSKDDVVVGKLNVVSYDEVKKNLVIVEVNNATYPGNINTLTNELNKTYAQGVAGWTSVTKQSMTVTGLGEKLDDGESGLLSNYTADMKTVLNAFTKNNTLANDTYYLFLIKAANDPNKLGYMPRKKQAGFIFLDAHSGNEAQLINTIAHELGHGAFRLKHTFSEYSSLSQGATDNLMDYNRGMRLNKYQWDFIHNPEVVLGLFEDDEEGAMKYDCPMWFSGECEDVGLILDLVKETSTKGSNITLSSPFAESRNELLAEGIELDDAEFRKIKIVNMVEKDKKVTFDPRNFEEYTEEFLDTEGKSDYQRGFVYRDGESTQLAGGLTTPAKVIMKILLYEKEENFAAKKEALKKYLFGETKQTNEPASVDGHYVIYKGDANIRNKTAPYGLIAPTAYLEKGREVELISNLTEGDGARALVKYIGEVEEYCTSKSNLKEIIQVNDKEQYKLKEKLLPFVSPYSEKENDEISTDQILFVTHECGPYKCINKETGDGTEKLGWVESKYLRRYVDISKLSQSEFNSRMAEATSTAVDSVLIDWKNKEAACNLCLRAALRNLTGDDVLYPAIGSTLTIREASTKRYANPETFYGKVIEEPTKEGSAQGIVLDLYNGTLDDYFEEIKRNETEDYPQYWERLQKMVDNEKAIIVGAYNPGHVFMIVPGGLYKVVDNKERESSGVNETSPKVELGDKWGASYIREKLYYVPRTMDCGAGVKFSNGALYGVMDAKPVIGKRENRELRFFRYKAK